MNELLNWISSFINALKKDPVALIAFAALIQPWAIYLGRKLLLKRKVELFLPGFGGIQISYGYQGPVLTLSANLLTHRRDAYVQNVWLDIVRIHDGAKSQFVWVGHQPETGQNLPFEAPNVFKLSRGEPRRLQLWFVDNKRNEEVTKLLHTLRSAFWEKLQDKMKQEESKESESKESENKELDVSVAAPTVYKEFQHDPAHLQAYTDLDRSFSWEATEYRMDVKCLTTDGQTVSFAFTFMLTQDHIKMLRSNVIRIVQSTCGETVPSLNVAFPGYTRV